MKKNKHNLLSKSSFLIMFCLAFALLFTGCSKNIHFDSSNSNVLPDGINFDMKYNQDVTVTVDDPSDQGENVVIDDSDEEESDEDEEDSKDNPDDENNESDEEDKQPESDDDSDADDEDASDDNNQNDEENIDDSSNADDGDDGAANDNSNDNGLSVVEDGEYTSKEEVALYIHTFNHLPSNFITKKQAKELGWEGGKDLNKFAPGKSIGGDRFGNREGLLPDKDGRQYYECDIDYTKGKRNAKRIVFSNDGLVYYTEDHYESYELLYQ